MQFKKKANQIYEKSKNPAIFLKYTHILLMHLVRLWEQLIQIIQEIKENWIILILNLKGIKSFTRNSTKDLMNLQNVYIKFSSLTNNKHRIWHRFLLFLMK